MTDPFQSVGSDHFAICPSFMVTFHVLRPWATTFDLNPEKNQPRNWYEETELGKGGKADYGSSIQTSQNLESISVLKGDLNACFSKKAVFFFLPSVLIASP